MGFQASLSLAPAGVLRGGAQGSPPTLNSTLSFLETGSRSLPLRIYKPFSSESSSALTARHPVSQSAKQSQDQDPERSGEFPGGAGWAGLAPVSLRLPVVVSSPFPSGWPISISRPQPRVEPPFLLLLTPHFCSSAYQTLAPQTSSRSAGSVYPRAKRVWFGR